MKRPIAPVVGLLLILGLTATVHAQHFTVDRGFVRDSSNNFLEGVSPHVYKDTSGNWVMILQSYGSAQVWGCSLNDKIGYYTLSGSDPLNGWVKGQRIGNCDSAGDYRTHGVGSVVHNTNYRAPDMGRAASVVPRRIPMACACA